MRVLDDDYNKSLFPIRIRCEYTTDDKGEGYGVSADYCKQLLEIELSDIVRYDYYKFIKGRGTDYGVICPECGMFIVVDEKLIPKSIKKNARKVTLINGRLKDFKKPAEDENTKKFTFDIVQKIQVEIEATDINRALRRLHEQHPDMKSKDLLCVRQNGDCMPYEISKSTGRRIYYTSGCSNGRSDCPKDPMRKIAKSCRRQSDLTDEKQIICSHCDK